MTGRILIVTDRGDLHADLVIAKIAAAGGRPFRLDCEAFPRDFAIDLEFAGGRWHGALAHLPSGDSLAVAEIGAVWLRKKADFGFLSEPLAPQEKAFAEAEVEHILFSLLYSLDCYWMSHPRRAARRAAGRASNCCAPRGWALSCRPRWSPTGGKASSGSAPRPATASSSRPCPRPRSAPAR